MIGMFQIQVIFVTCLLAGILSAVIAGIRNRTKWKAFLVGLLLTIPGLIGILVFLKTKGTKTKKGKILEIIIVISIILLFIAGILQN